MALNQVGARTEGDVYQGLFFWREAANLLRPSSMVERVVLEHDEAEGVDDVAVFYREPGVNAGGWLATADYYQLKYHVDNRDCYSADAMMDPTFINAKTSLLQRFYVAFTKLTQTHGKLRLHLASNWRWKSEDKLAALLREDGGALPRKFFEDGPRSDLGKIRERWRQHLKLEPDAFSAFAKSLRFQLDHFGRRGFEELVYATLEAAGLRIPSANRAACPYESLVQKFLMDGPNSFDVESFRELCIREGLMLEAESCKPRPFSIGVRSFIRFAERLESEVDDFVCVSENFEGRQPISHDSWDKSASIVRGFLADVDRRSRLRGVESVISLECHGSLALLAGWELSRNSGAQIAPIQKPNLQIWRPSYEPPDTSVKWEVKTIPEANDIDDVAICLSVTHDIQDAVVEYLQSKESPRIGQIVLMSPPGGPSPESIKGADYANKLASQVPGVLTKARPKRSAKAHIFFACPNSLLFFIGQHRDALGAVALYEYDFGFERDGSYSYSFSLPIAQNALLKT